MRINGNLMRPMTTLAAMLTCGPAAAITVTVDQTVTYQTIEGIGLAQNPGSFTGGWRYRSGPFYVNVNLDAIGFYDTVLADGGLTAMRSDPVTAFQATQGDFTVSGTVRAELQ
jgi:hypothetical protein